MEDELRSGLTDNIKIVKYDPNNPIAIINILGWSEWFIQLASLLAQYAAEEILKKYRGMNPVDISRNTLNEIENFLYAFVEESLRLEYEGLVRASIEKFNLYNDTGERHYLESIVETNVEAMSVLEMAGPGGFVAWMMAAQNVMSALLIMHGEGHDVLKNAAKRYLQGGVDFMLLAANHNRNRVSGCNDNCDQGTDTKWRCCYVFDGNEYCTKRQSKPDARTLCNQDADSTRERVRKEWEFAIFYPAMDILNKWAKIS